MIIGAEKKLAKTNSHVTPCGVEWCGSTQWKARNNMTLISPSGQAVGSIRSVH